MSNTESPFPDIRKMLEQMKLPGVDVNAIIEAQRNNIEALTRANQQAYQNLQTLATRQSEVMHKAAVELQGAMKDMAGKNPAEAAKVGMEFTQRAVQGALSNMLELAQTAQLSQAKAMEEANRRFQEYLEGLRKMIPPK